MLIILRYNFDCGSLGELIWSATAHKVLLIYFSISWRSEGLMILLVEMITLLTSVWMKSAIMFNLMFLRALLILVTWELDSLMKYLACSMFIGIITCFFKGPLVVMLIHGLGFVTPLIIFWTCLILWSWRFRNVFLIFSVSLTMFDTLLLEEACAYNFFCGIPGFFLKNFEISLTSFRILARMGGRIEEIETRLMMFLPLLFCEVLRTCRLNLDFTLFLNNMLVLSTTKLSQCASYRDKINSYAILPTLLRSLMLLALLPLMDLPRMYFRILMRDFLIFLISDTKYSKKP